MYYIENCMSSENIPFNTHKYGNEESNNNSMYISMYNPEPKYFLLLFTSNESVRLVERLKGNNPKNFNKLASLKM